MFAPAAGEFCATLLTFSGNIFFLPGLHDAKKMSDEMRLISRCRSYPLESIIAVHASCSKRDEA
jgi:hypothetical protein